MKVYTKIIFDQDGLVLEEESYEYEGPLALAGGGPKPAKAEASPSGKIVTDLYKTGGLKDSLQGILANPGDDPFTQRQMDVLTQRSRGAMGARGLASSGIGLQSEQQALSDFMLQRGEQKQGQAIQILGAGGTAPQFGPQQQPRGLFGMK